MNTGILVRWWMEWKFRFHSDVGKQQFGLHGDSLANIVCFLVCFFCSWQFMDESCDRSPISLFLEHLATSAWGYLELKHLLQRNTWNCRAHFQPLVYIGHISPIIPMSFQWMPGVIFRLWCWKTRKKSREKLLNWSPILLPLIELLLTLINCHYATTLWSFLT